MATKTISITESAYKRLAALKTNSDSFSEVITRITKKASLMDLVGLLTKDESEKVRKRVLELRKASKERLEKVRKIMIQK